MFLYTVNLTATLLIKAETEEDMWSMLGDMFHNTDGGEIFEGSCEVGVAPIIEF